MPPTQLIPTKEWTDRTALFGRPRSDVLKRLDSAIAAYEKNPATGTAAIRKAFADWKTKQGAGDAWRKSPRNLGKPIGVFTELDLRLNASDSDQALGVKSGEVEHHRHARLGVLYLYSSMTVSTNLFGVLLETAGDIAGGAFNFDLSATSLLTPKIDALSGVSQTAAQAGQKLLGGVEAMAEKKVGGMLSNAVFGVQDPAGKKIVMKPKSEAEQTLWQWLKDYVMRLLEKLRDKFTSLQTYAPIFAAAIKAAVSQISAQAGSYFTDAVTTYAGLEQTIKSFGERIVSAISMNGVKLVNGYPAAVVDAIHRSMSLSGLDGLSQVARGGAGIATTALAPAFAPVVSLVLSVCDKLFRLVWRVAEIGEMKTVFGRSRDEYKLGKAYEAALRDGKTAQAPLHARPIDFAKWFRANAISVPVLACLTLTSGICGDKMTYLAMYNDDGAELTDKQFLKGVDGIDALKQWGSNYLASSGYEFHSSDSFVSKLLTAHASNDEALRENQMGKVEKLYEHGMTLVGAR